MPLNPAPSPRSARTPRPGPRRAFAEAGMTLIEITIALLIIALATLGSVSWTLSGMGLEAENTERAAADEVLRGVLEQIQALPFEEIFARLNDDPNDDPLGKGTAPGGRWWVEADRHGDFLTPSDSALSTGKSPKRGQEDVWHAPVRIDIELPVDKNGRLSETDLLVVVRHLAWDLDGDGQISTADCTNSYRVLPLRVRVTWVGAKGERSVQHVRLFAKRNRPGGA